MGLKNSATLKFVRLRDGKFYLGADKENFYNELEGTITDLSFKTDEFEGQKIKKLVIKLVDDESETYVLSIPFESGYTSSLIGFIKNADLSKPITLSPSAKEKPDGKSERRIFVRQNGENLKSFYTKDNPNGLPSMKKVVKKSGKVEWDKEDYLDFLENVVLNELRPSLGKEKTKTVDLVSTDETEDANDLPF